MASRRRPHANPGSWSLQRERFALTSREPPAPELTSSFDDAIKSVLKDVGLGDRLWEQQLHQEWPALVGPQIARHTRPVRLQRKTLLVFVTNTTWLNELVRYGQRPILEKIQAKYGADKVLQLRLQLDPDVQPDRSGRATKPGTEPGA